MTDIRMRFFSLLAAAVLSFAVASSVHAATKSKADAGKCQAYQHRVDDALTANPNARKLDHAKSEREAGEKACDAGQYDAGVKHFKSALGDLGVKAVKQQ